MLHEPARREYSVGAMPKPYSAPIPIYGELGVNDRNYEPVKRYPWPVMDSGRIQQNLFSMRDEAADAGRMELARGLHEAIFAPDRRQQEVGVPIIKARYVLNAMEDIRHLALWAAVRFESDVLDIDDIFLTFCHPRVVDWMTDLGPLEDGELNEEAGAEYLRDVATIAERWPLINMDRLHNIAIKGKNAPVCWHRDRHSKLRRRGRQWTPTKRAAAWATYCIAWLVGSESSAVRLWNAWDNDTRWGSDDRSGIKIYGATKRRLVKSLVYAMGAAVTPPTSSARPYDTVPNDIIERVRSAIQESLASGNAPPIWEPETVTVEA